MGEQKQQKQTNADNGHYGAIKIADEAVAMIASMAAVKIKGVAAMSGGVAAGITEKLGKKNLTKGVKVEVTGQSVALDLFIHADFGAKIPQLAHEIQNEVRTAVETMTGLEVKSVNVHIQGISFAINEQEGKKEAEE